MENALPGFEESSVVSKLLSNQGGGGVSHSLTTGKPGQHRTDVARARGARLENPRNFLRDSRTGRTLEDRERQLRDEGMSGVNQHADIRLIHRRFMLLVP